MTDGAFEINIEWSVVFDAFLKFFFDESALAEIKSSTYRPRYSGGSPSMRVPVKMHGALGRQWRPRDWSAFLAVLYQ